MIRFILDNRSHCQYAPRILRIISEGVSEELESLEVLPCSDVEEADRCEYLWILWWKLKRLEIDLDGSSIVQLSSVNLAQLDIGAIVLLEVICFCEGSDGFFVDTKVFETEASVEVDFPVLIIKLQTLIIDINGGLMPS